jgi:hypothetical protein
MTEGAARHAFTPDDLAQLAVRGISLDEAARQLALLARPSHHLKLDRPCTPGDGIETVGDAGRYTRAWESAAREGRLAKFVPASGVASRMFRELIRFHEPGAPLARDDVRARAARGDADARVLETFLASIGRFAFHDSLARHVRATGRDLEACVESDVAAVLEALLSERGMGCAELPKGLLEFHRYGASARTPFEEQLVEAAELVRDAADLARLHFTVSPGHRAAFDALLDRARAHEGASAIRFDVGFSTQKPSTDTLAADAEGRPFRGPDGALVFRPAGHGALLENMQDLDADVVLVKNIDNVVPDRLKGPTYEWSRIVAGMLVEVQAAMHEHLRAIENGDSQADVDRAAEFLADRLNAPLPPAARGAEARRRAAIALLDRPLRVCGMVPNTGEPGGGPFFVVDAQGAVSRQIVESAQIDLANPDQASVFRRATHFNPVFMACGLRDHRNRAFDLSRFVDPAAVIVTGKSSGGSAVRALERPGLWNGAMSNWASIFVEVPGAVFHPVKSVLDLLRPEHQPA